MKLLLVILFQLSYIHGVACDCSEKLFRPFQSENYEEVDLIYLVEIGLETDSGVFEVKLIESFKGAFNPNTKIVNGGYCSEKVSPGERWIIYTNEGPTDLTSVYGCSRSRDINRRKYWVPPPPPPKSPKDKREHEVRYANYLNSDRGDIEEEIKQLRELKANAR